MYKVLILLLFRETFTAERFGLSDKLIIFVKKKESIYYWGVAKKWESETVVSKSDRITSFSRLCKISMPSNKLKSNPE